MFGYTKVQLNITNFLPDKSLQHDMNNPWLCWSESYTQFCVNVDLAPKVCNLRHWTRADMFIFGCMFNLDSYPLISEI
jgi:hypothetical protein